jgi:hypothetical protein
MNRRALGALLLVLALAPVACQRAAPTPAPAPVASAAPPPDVAGAQLAELGVLLELTASSQLAARLACGLPGLGAHDDSDDKGRSEASACNDRLSRLEAHLVVAEGATRVARSCEARGDRACRAVALRVARGELPELRRLVASRGLASLASPGPAPAGGAP